MNYDINEVVKSAKEGNRDALERLIQSIQDRIYRLSLKMLYQPADAEDATQEILIRIITKLDSFRGESSFFTWAFTIASNHLKNNVKQAKLKRFTFQGCEAAILNEVPDQTSVYYSKAEQDLLVEEMRIVCMQGLLQCLDPDHRLAYVLGSTMEINSTEGALILEISPSAFRKRLSRARENIRKFLVSHCDLIDGTNRCNCASQAQAAVKKGRIQPEKLRFADKPVSESVMDVKSQLETLDTMSREVALMRMNQAYIAPETFIETVRNMLNR